MEGTEDQVSGFGGFDGDGDGFEVAHFADEDDIGVFAQGGAQRGLKAFGVDVDFALVDEAAFVGVNELDGVFDGDDVGGAVAVDVVDHGGEGGGFTGASGASDDDEAFI